MPQSDSEFPEDSSSPGFSYVHSAQLPDLLGQLGISLLISTYQAGKVMVIRARGGRISTLLRHFDQAMGLAVSSDRLAIGAKNQVWCLRNAPDIAAQIEPPGTHDACFVPTYSHVTGDVRVHEMAWVDRDLWFVNTRFSCLCTLDPDHSFVPRWQPPFVTGVAAEDRCHLSGLAVDDSQVTYVTALGESDTPQGWRPGKAQGGILIHVPTSQIVARGLSMPHSPRIYDGKLWVLDSGRGQLKTLDPVTGTADTVAELPGFTRGLAFFDRYAFVGLSKIREKKEFGGLPIESMRDSLQCGVYVVDIHTAEVVGLIEFTAGCTELFDVQVLPDCRWPAIVGLKKETINNTFIVPK